MNQKIANNMYKFTLYNILYTLIREENTNIKVVELENRIAYRPSSCETLRQV